MRKFTFYVMLLSVLSGIQKLSAQLYVSPNSFVYVNNQYVTVTQDVNLQANGNIYLRSEGQLLQKKATLGSNNQGAGELSLFQEGTSDNYAYNYWSSPVGAASGAAGNTNFGITQLNRPTAVTNISSLPATILPSPALDGSSAPGSLQIAARWVFTYPPGTTYAGWNPIGSTTAIGAAQGFTMKGTSGVDGTTVLGVPNNPGSKQRYDFKGRPNDGTIGVSVIGTAGNMTLTGNPYPSAIDLDAFLNDSGNTPFIDGTALFWEHDPSAGTHILANYRGGYGTYNATNGLYTPAKFYTYDNLGNAGSFTSPNNNYERRFSPVGQGFMIRGTNAGTVYFKNTNRVFRKEGFANNSEFHKNNASQTTTDYGNYGDIPNVAGTDYTQISKAPTPHIVINGVLNETGVSQVVLCFMPDALDGVDRADSKAPDMDANLPYDMYLYLNDDRYIHSATSFDINKTYPLGFRNNVEATYRIQVAEFVNFTAADNVYVHDLETGLYHDIKNSEYQVTLPAGANNTRFEITFVNRALGSPNFTAESFDVVQNNVSQTLSIANPKMIDLKSVALYDIGGKLIFKKVALGSKGNYQFSTSGISDAVYIVKMTTADNQESAKKITVHNSK